MKAVANVDLAVSVFDSVRQTLNIVSDIVTNEAMTANSSMGINVGNADLTGQFSANVLVANSTIRGGNSSVSSALKISSDGFSVGGQVLFMTGRVATTNTNSNQVIDSFPIASYGVAHYLLHVVGGTNSHYTSHVHVVHDGTTPLSTEFGIVSSNGAVGTFSVSSNATQVQLLFSPTAAVSNVTFRRETLVV